MSNKKTKKFDIYKTFEIFNRLLINVIKDEIIKFVLVETDGFLASSSYVQADINKNDVVQLSILNNQKLYNIITNSWSRYQQKKNNEGY